MSREEVQARIAAAVAFVREHRDMEEASVRFNMTRDVVRRACRAAGLLALGRDMTEDDKAKVRAGNVSGLRAPELARRLGLSAKQINSFLFRERRKRRRANATRESEQGACL